VHFDHPQREDPSDPVSRGDQPASWEEFAPEPATTKDPLGENEPRGFIVFSHGHNGDSPFRECETYIGPEDGGLAEAKAHAEELMKTRRYQHMHNGKPTVQWCEIFGPGIEESLGLEERDGELYWSGS
jgi:hypothetical protein